MYAVIDAGGKQARVEVGDLVDVELLSSEEGSEVSLKPLLVVEGENVLAGAGSLADAAVTATVIGETLGPKITGFTYKPKTRQRRRYGHRQRYTMLEITRITGMGLDTNDGADTTDSADTADTVDTTDTAESADTVDTGES